MTMVEGRVLLYLQYVWWEVGSCCTCSKTMVEEGPVVLALCMMEGTVLLYLQ